MDLGNAHGDIWKLQRDSDYVVVPTNIGWNKEGLAIMGKGLAAGAARRASESREWYGRACQKYKAGTPTLGNATWRLVFFPTKPFNPRVPAMSWKGPATVAQIERSLASFVTLLPKIKAAGGRRVLFPHVGCGEGGLEWRNVLPLIRAALDPVDAALVPEVIIVEHVEKFDHRSAWLGSFVAEEGGESND